LMGMTLRNKWHLRKHRRWLFRKQPLVAYFNSYGIGNPALMSYTILEAYNKKLNGKEYHLDDSLKNHPFKYSELNLMKKKIKRMWSKVRGKHTSPEQQMELH
jgi:hypothetical protein